MGFTFWERGLRVEREERKVVGSGGKRGGLRSIRADEENEVRVRVRGLMARQGQACNERRESGREGFWIRRVQSLALWER